MYIETSDVEAAARNYVDQLLDEAAEHPVDKDVNSYDMQLPSWYDEIKFKR